MLQTAWLLVRMVNNTKLLKLHISFSTFTRLMKKLLGKVLSTAGLFLLNGHIYVIVASFEIINTDTT